MKDSIFDIEGFTSYRKDRTDGRKGGGCALYVNKKLKSFACQQLKNLPGDDIVWCWVKPTNETMFLVVNIYRSPTSTAANNRGNEPNQKSM